MNIEIIACGRLKKGAFYDLFQEYHRRMEWDVTLIECESRSRDPSTIHRDETTQILNIIDPQAFVIAMDERGKTLSSRDIAVKMQDLQNTNRTHIQCLIGGADGLNDKIRIRADMLLSFGKQTWPHMLARVMLLEQIYRSQQILKNHPYHRD